jgi:hypothetical protein
MLAVLPNLRMPHLNGGKFKYRGNDKMKGYTFGLDYGLGDEQSNVEFPDSAVGKWEIETKEGGSVVLRWQVSYAGDRITDDALVKLVRHEQKQAFITLKPAATLVLVKGGKAKPAAAPQGEGGEDLFDEGGEGDDGGDDDADNPEKAMERAHAA